MDARSRLVEAIVAGAAAIRKKDMPEPVWDAYRTLAAYLRRRYPALDLDAVARAPTAAATRASLHQALAGAAGDETLRGLAEQMLQASGIVGVDLQDVTASRATIEDVQVRGRDAIGVRVQESAFDALGIDQVALQTGGPGGTAAVWVQNVRGDVTIDRVSVQYRLEEQPPLYEAVPPMPARFVGRQAAVEAYVRRLRAEAPVTAAVHGMPGVGKTALAIALAHHKDLLAHFSDGVLWARIGPKPALMPLLDRWARALGQSVAELDDLALRARIVCSAIGQKRLLVVLDDVWDAAVVQLLRCGAPHAAYVVTTRDQRIARQIDPMGGPVPELDPDPAHTLLQTLAPEAWAADPDGARALADATGGLPLALELLGGYLGAPERTIFRSQRETALRAMTDPEQRLVLAQQRLGGGPTLSLPETIQLSLDGLGASDTDDGDDGEAARAAFCALGAFAPKPATFDLDAARVVTGAGEDVLALLAVCNLIEVDPDGTLALHQVVADVARQHTSPEAYERHLRHYLSLVHQDPDDWRRIEPIYDQIRQGKATTDDPDAILALAYLLAPFQDHHVLWEERDAWTKDALRVVEAEDRKKDQAHLKHNLAGLHGRRGRYAEAEPLYREALAIRKDLLGAHHPDVAVSYTALAMLYVDQGRYDEAESLYQQALAIQQKELGDRHPSTANSLNGLAILHAKRGQLPEAEALFQKTLAIREAVLGAHHPDTAESYSNLAMIYAERGRYAEAEPLYRKVIAIREEQLGRHHPDLAASYGNLAGLYLWQERYAEAEPLLVKALEIQMNLLGEYHPDTAKGRSNLAGLYVRQERYAEAEPLYRTALEVLKQVLGEVHPEVAISYNNLAGLYGRMGRLAEAEPLFRKAIEIREHTLGPQHPDTARSYADFATFLARAGFYTEAAPYARQALQTTRQVLGDQHPMTVLLQQNYAVLLDLLRSSTS